MQAEKFVKILNEVGIEYFCGVPDSQLSAFTDAVVERYGFDERHHTVAANEGCAVGLAAGYHLASGKHPCVYMQNSGLGNAVNPITSLLNRAVYGIGCLFVIGHRGEPNVHDEPQHVFMGEITLAMLSLLGIKYIELENGCDEEMFRRDFSRLAELLPLGESVAIVVKKGALKSASKHKFSNDYSLNRESVIESISALLGDDDVVVSTTGKISRELYEARKRQGKNSGKDFLTVGSMGHCSSIALAISVVKRDRRVIVLDGDGALLMHMGALVTIGNKAHNNLVHILLDNAAHETVGGMPTLSNKADICKIALASGYTKVVDISKDKTLAESIKELKEALEEGKAKGALFIRIPVALGSRSDLARPKEKPIDNKLTFMENLIK